jgi:vacuolar-type H+-ATPase subunit F/Vma7
MSPQLNKPSHCFALNGDILKPECDGLQGVVSAYQHALKNVNLYGPTHFGSVLELINDLTESMQVTQINQKYNILLIITDGVINDLQQSIDQIVRGSSLPLSIIIVGVGDADFGQMDVLDADDEPLFSTKYKRHMASDIVQFVPYRQFMHNPMLLAKETLTEVPTQLLGYFRRNGIRPNPASEAQKMALQRQLSRQNSLGMGQQLRRKHVEDFFKKKKEELLQELQEFGVDIFQAQDFMENKGIFDFSKHLIVPNMQYPGYINPLRQY